MVSFNIRELIYRKLNPITNKLGFKILVINYSSYSAFGKKLDVKLDSLGLSKNSIDELNDALSNYSFVVVLKSREYVPYGDVIDAFREFGMKDGDLKALSTKQSENLPFGSFDASVPASKRSFFYWFPVDIEDID